MAHPAPPKLFAVVSLWTNLSAHLAEELASGRISSILTLMYGGRCFDQPDQLLAQRLPKTPEGHLGFN